VLENLSREARLMTDEHTMYRRIGREFAEHGAVHHYNKEYVRGDVTTNTIEGLSASSSAACAASISIAPRSTCTAIWPSLSSATATAKRPAATTRIAPTHASWYRRQAPDLSNNCCEGLMPKYNIARQVGIALGLAGSRVVVGE
jgi:hypothetical protein